jgi:hypothetical protein
VSMWASLALDLATIIAPSISMGFAGWQANTYYRHKAEQAESKVKGLTLAEVMQKGNEIVAQMAADVHKLYHPPGEDGKPCACAICEIRADDEPAEKPKDWTAEEATQAANVAPEYVRALQDKINGLRKENAQLRKGSGERVVTKVQERKTALQNEIEQAQRLVDDKPVMLNLEPSAMTNGHPMHVMIAPKVEPDAVIESFGVGPVRAVYNRRPQSGPGSRELGIMDRQLGTIGRICDRCNEGKAWKILGDKHICKQCFYTMSQDEVTSIRQENGRKYVCYRDGHCEVT